ncbi:MAG: hypothetical protein RLZZ230_180 [Candidatus Parcubacteria bacterium]|jgi:predicted MPP superfamily phosphohydrolase
MPLMFLVFILIAWGIMFLLHFVVYASTARVFNFSLPYWQLTLGLLAASYLLASITVRNIQNPIADVFYFIAATWLGTIFIIFSCVAVYEIIHFATGFESTSIFTGVLIFSALLSSYAIYNGRAITTREYTIPIVGLEKPLRIVHLSDIHVGTVHQIKYLEEVVTLTNKTNPDLVLITGDLFDGSAPINTETLLPLKTLQAPTFITNGNHEFYEGLNHVHETLKALDLNLLEDSAVEIDSIQILGLNDGKSIPRDKTLTEILNSLPPVASSTPRILMYHTPIEWDEARAQGVSLMLSGHTHNGQIFPFTLLVRAAFKYYNGLYEVDGKYLHVTPGTGTWGPPMRLGSNNQITVLNLVPIKD